MEFWFFKTEIWYAQLGLCKNWMLIMQDEKCQLYNFMQKKLNSAIGNL